VKQAKVLVPEFQGIVCRLAQQFELLFVPEERPGIEQLVQRITGPETKMQRLVRLTGIDLCR
jgi:hypothetical protein